VFTRISAIVVVAIVTVLSHTGSGQSPAQVAPGRSPIVVPAIHHDVSPPLRGMPALAPITDAQREVKEPGPIRRGRGPGQRRIDTVVQDFPSASTIPLPSMTFEGVGNGNGVLPPDTNGDVGPNHYVQWVNLSFAIWTKGSATTPPALVYGPAAGNTLWRGFGGPCETRNDGDPIVMYDHIADRWFMSQLAIPNNFFGFLFAPFYQCIAVSATSDPTGAYYRYQFQFNKLNDYPKFGLWPDGYYMAINQFQPIYLNWAGQGVAVFDRVRMLNGQPASMIFFDLASVDMNLGGMLPAHLAGSAPPPGSPEYFVQIDDDAWGYSPDQLQVWQFHTDWSNPQASTFSNPARLPVAPFDSDLCGAGQLCVPQPGTTVKLDPMSDRLMYRLQYRNFGDHESLVVNHTVDVDGTDHAGVRWYEVRSPGSAPVVYQQGTYAPDANHRWMGSVAMDRTGNMALGYSVSGTTTFPSIRYTGRLATDPPGVMTQGEADMMVGSGSQLHTSGRWGDYSLLAVDPIDQCTFWYTQEYLTASTSAGWQTRVGAFAFPSCTSTPLPPSVTVTAPAPRATEAGLTSGLFAIGRTGDVSAPLTVHFTVTGTATPGSDYVALPSSVTFAAGVSSIPLAVTPLDDAIVEPDETVVLTLDWDPSYVGGSPSSAAVAIVSDDLPADLIVSALTAPPVAGAGLTISVADTTINQGGGSALASYNAFFLSTNALLDKSDIPLGVRAVPALAPGASSQATTVLTIPSTTPTGTYYIVAAADASNVNLEAQEGNNTRATAGIPIGPDLVISTITVPATAAAGAPLTVSETTLNQGGGDAAPTRTGFYLSTTGGVDATSILLGTRDVPALAPAGSSSSSASSASTSVVMPAGTTAGLYYIVAVADQAGIVTETQEYNNRRAGYAIKVGPDLVVSSITTPAPGGAGATLMVTDTTKNQGGGSAASSSTAFFLSADMTLDAFDVPLGSRTVAALAGNATDTATTPIQIPGTTATGVYFVLAKADANNQVVESYENNNVASVYVRIGPDLTVSGLSISGSVTGGATITINDTTRNTGGGDAVASTTRFYLSTDIYLNAGDVLLGSRDVPALAGGAFSPGSTMCTIPPGTPAGSYQLLAVADSASVVPETSEANNIGLLWVVVR
jgi:CARDB protein/Calx-beta domain-containing protein